jgi:hypothetical protein
MKKNVPDIATGTAMAGIKGRPEILKEYKYHDKYQHECFNQSMFNLFDRFVQRCFGTIELVVFDTRQEKLLDAFSINLSTSI